MNTTDFRLGEKVKLVRLASNLGSRGVKFWTPFIGMVGTVTEEAENPDEFVIVQLGDDQTTLFPAWADEIEKVEE